MKYLKEFCVFESKTNPLEDFKKKFGTTLDEKFTPTQVKLLEKAFSLFKKKFIKGKITKIKLEDLGGVHGRWTNDRKFMTLNPSIFNFTKKFKDNGFEVDYKLFVIVHEIGHCLDHIEGISTSSDWKSISGWKKCPIDKKIPEGWKRYVEKRKGREKAGHKKSDWIHKEDAEFCRKYSSRNPKEDFADCFAFATFKQFHKFKGELGKKKLDIIKKLIKEVE